LVDGSGTAVAVPVSKAWSNGKEVWSTGGVILVLFEWVESHTVAHSRLPGGLEFQFSFIVLVVGSFNPVAPEKVELIFRVVSSLKDDSNRRK